MKGRYGTLPSPSQHQQRDRDLPSESDAVPDPILDIQFHFQIGFHREHVVVSRSDLTMTTVKEMACQALKNQVSPLFAAIIACIRIVIEVRKFNFLMVFHETQALVFFDVYSWKSTLFNNKIST